jgi:hypothetical protein
MPDGKCCRSKTFIVAQAVASPRAITGQPIAAGPGRDPPGVFPPVGIHESCHGLDRGEQGFCETAAIAPGTAVSERGETAPRLIPHNGTDSGHSGMGANQYSRADAGLRFARRPRRSPARRRSSRLHCAIRPSPATGGAGDCRIPGTAGRPCPANRHSFSPHWFRARVRPRARPSSGPALPVELVTFH